ncbi:aminotransferase class III-fold pyridoxal phosphate-dependent enzyme [Occallatibacter riparius]|uniref:Aminotransferase class III-fold pyridoxal phosphate-dependent enzyme n=1 Tax=Occallatibacter riparius TaxID=1002689 RepID=A0A9J7BVC1_9BACT|nr:aminotransferase class III-fold pyridoxal phosphate-dependent enzyme [Occallatibacter riparius]UWZ86827.1 aminotransferase class III-fold pyridoxal phosphate-dependent enzyme [Occallatibacter riparius]
MNSEAGSSQTILPDEAVQLVRDLYEFEVSASSLPGEYDNNFHIVTSDGRAFVLKVMHSSRDRAFIDMQCSALTHLAERAPGLALQRVQLTRSGEAFVRTTLRNGEERFVWLLSFLPGRVLAEVRPHTPELLRNLGSLLGHIDLALQDFSHPAAAREFKWDLAQAAWIREYLFHIEDPSRRALVEQVLEQYEKQVVPQLPTLRKSVIYGDANDYNVLVSCTDGPSGQGIGVIDFGDMHHGLVVAEPAVAAAYAVLGKSEPLEAAASLVEGFHSVFPLLETELAILFPLIRMRLAVSVVNSAHRKTLVPDDPYVTISEAPAWDALARLANIHERFAHYVFRNACGLPPMRGGQHFRQSLATIGKTAASVVDLDLRTEPCLVFDLSVASTFLGADPKASQTPALTLAIERELRAANASVGVGRYDEPRLLYTSPLFGTNENAVDERRTVHLGIDLFLDAGSNARAPLDGQVHIIADNLAPLDYGPIVILKHLTDDAVEFFTLYGHLSKESIAKLSTGQPVTRGEAFANIGAAAENGGWPPHLHFQIITDLLELNEKFPGVARASERAIWTDLCPDPNLLLGIPSERFPSRERSLSDTLLERRSLMGPNLSVSYERPLKIVRGWRQYLYDDTGRAYLDVYNNVPLVGHSHPKVVDAVRKQLGLLNTNTRYLHDNVVRYAQRLTRTLPEPLRVCYFVNSGSEANELALRLARTHTNRDDIIVLEHAYHGHTNTLIDISPYKFNGPGGKGCKPWVHVAPIADDYRGIYRRGEPGLGIKYAGHVHDILNRLQIEGRGAAASIAETMPSVGGQIVFPPDYLAEVYRHVRAAGAVCIADEVQVGFGRLGTHFWGFETQGVIPDIVVLGKPIGNAFPLAAVITTPEIAASFDNGMEFFSTFGGNPVSCAAGLAVLDVLEEEQLQENAFRVGSGLRRRLKALQERHPLIGDVRGSGLFLGLDLVQDRATREAATEQASYICNRLRERGILTGTDGPFHNVIKLRPPLIFSDHDTELFVTTLETILEEDRAQPGTP